MIFVYVSIRFSEISPSRCCFSAISNLFSAVRAPSAPRPDPFSFRWQPLTFWLAYVLRSRANSQCKACITNAKSRIIPRTLPVCRLPVVSRSPVIFVWKSCDALRIPRIGGKPWKAQEKPTKCVSKSSSRCKCSVLKRCNAPCVCVCMCVCVANIWQQININRSWYFRHTPQIEDSREGQAQSDCVWGVGPARCTKCAKQSHGFQCQM